MSLIQMLNDCAGSQNYSAIFDGTRMLERVPVTASGRKKFTLSVWFKGANGMGSFSPSPLLCGYDLTGSAITNRGEILQDWDTQFPNGPGNFYYDDTVSTDIFSTNGDTSGPGGGSVWHHFLMAVDTTVGTEADRVKAYINNNLITTGRAVQCALNLDPTITLNELHMIGAQFTDVNVDYVTDIQIGRMQIAEMYYIDNQQLTPASFLIASAPIKAKKYTGTYGLQSFYLNFSDSNNMGKDFSGNGNNYAPHAGYNAPIRSTSSPFRPV